MGLFSRQLLGVSLVLQAHFRLDSSYREALGGFGQDMHGIIAAEDVARPRRLSLSVAIGARDI